MRWTALVFAVVVFMGAQGDGELQRLRADFEVAEATFNSINQPDAIAEFNRIITVLERRLATRDDPETRALLVASLSYRARASFNIGDSEASEIDIRAMVGADPNLTLDRQVSPRFVDLFEGIRSDMVGRFELLVSPVDAQIRVDGRLLDPGVASHAVVAGVHAVTVERPGYRPVRREIAVGAGVSAVVDDVLVRLSAVVKVLTRPAGARVRVDGSDLGITSGMAPPGLVLSGDAALYPTTDFSDELVVEGLQPGPHSIEVELDGYRPRSYELDVADLADYRATVVLEETAGEVVLDGLAPNASVMVDGAAAMPRRPGGAGSGSPRLTLAPGIHEIEVSQGTAGVFATTVEVVDRRVDVVDVRLRPGIAFLGVLGGDERGARHLSEALTGTLSGVDRWTVLDRSGAASSLDRLSLSPESLRSAASSPTDPTDWAAVQAEMDREAPGSVYLLAVLDDDLLATYADLWIWPAAPGPSRPDRVRVRLDNSVDIENLAGRFEASVHLSTNWFGALIVDVADVATVASVVQGSPADEAGLAVGDGVVSIAGEMATSTAVVRSVVEAASPGTAVAVQVQRGPATTIVEVVLGSSPRVISPADPELVYSVISASLASEASGGASAAPNWVVRLNQAAVLLHAGAWEDGVRMLRSIDDAPRGAGVGQATIDYWLGIALTALGPTYRDNAIEAFRKAAADPEARLFHNDGPWVAPRARARLAELGAF